MLSDLRSTEPAAATRALPPKSIITLVAPLRIDRRLGTQAAISCRVSGSLRLAAPMEHFVNDAVLGGPKLLVVEGEP